MRKFLIITFSVLGVSLLLISSAIAVFVYTPWGAHLAVEKAVKKYLNTGDIRWEKFEGSLGRGVVIRHLEIHGIKQLPAGNFLRVQTLTVKLRALSFDGLYIDFDNARLFPHGDEAIVFNAHLEHALISANVYTHSINLSDIREVVIQYIDMPRWKGTVRDVDLYVRGTVFKPYVWGTGTIESIDQNGFTLREAPVVPNLYFSKGQTRWETFGRVLVKGGFLTGPFVEMKLKDSRLTFSGRVVNPALDINASATVQHVNIDIAVRGTRKEPQVNASSDPPLSREEVLLMLMTGRRWTGLESMEAGQKKMTPELTGDFVDYLLFGGSGRKFIRYFGLSDIRFKAETNKQGVTVTKDISDKLDVGYGVEREVAAPTTEAAGQPVTSRQPVGFTQRVEGQYQLTNKVVVGVQKEFKSSAYRSNLTTVLPEDLPDDRVFFKYRTSF